MSYICYRDQTFKKASRAIIAMADKIANEYNEKGYDLTLRQLYYQFVARGLIENTERSYKRLGSMVNNGRMAGLINWDFITDRTRELRGVTHWGSPANIIKATARSYALDKWEGQKYRPEVWIEKDALVGVIASICQKGDSVDFLFVHYFFCLCRLPLVPHAGHVLVLTGTCTSRPHEPQKKATRPLPGLAQGIWMLISKAKSGLVCAITFLSARRASSISRRLISSLPTVAIIESSSASIAQPSLCP